MITKEEAKKMIHNTNDKIFSVNFTKKDGSARQMVCRRKVTKGVKGVGMSYNPSDYNLIPVYDMSKGFRMINASTITELKIEGINYKVAE
jgi:hypothetical protein